ncbi:hypothetical protein [Mariniflexile sp.]|uniref:hypothetical protein n=1 Tax=Mariniflexile sp. TaxID=1979402 RepID=UPI0035655F2F
MMLEEKMENKVIEVCNSNPMMGTPLASLAVMEAIMVVSENYKKSMLEGIEQLGLNEMEVIELIEDVKKKVYNNLIEH